MKKTGIYLIKNTKTLKVRVGSSIDIDKRFSNYKAKLRHGYGIKEMQEDYNEYGEQSFDFIILELCDKEKLLEREKYYLEEVYDDVAFYNHNKVIKTEYRKTHNKGKQLQSQKGEKNGNSKLNNRQAGEILWLRNHTDMKVKEIADIYNVCAVNVTNIAKRKTWKDIEEIKPVDFEEVV